MTSWSLEVFCPQCINDVASYLGEKRGGGKGVRFWGSLFTHSLADSRHIRKSLRVNINSLLTTTWEIPIFSKSKRCQHQAYFYSSYTICFKSTGPIGLEELGEGDQKEDGMGVLKWFGLVSGIIIVAAGLCCLVKLFWIARPDRQAKIGWEGFKIIK